MIYLLALSITLNAALGVLFLIYLRQSEDNARGERDRLLAMRVANPALIFDPEPTEWTPPTPDQFELAGRIVTEDDFAQGQHDPGA